MTGARRRIVTGIAAVGVLATGGVAVATGLTNAVASSTSSEPTVADLQERLAQLQSDTDGLNAEIGDAKATLATAKKAKDAEAATAAAARLASLRAAAAAAARSSAPTAVRSAAPAAHHKTVVHRVTTKKPVTHTTTGASGAPTSGDDSNESQGGSDD